MIVLLSGKATRTDLNADCESVLLENGSVQEDIWGANWYLDEQLVEFESLINIRPDQGNRGIVIQNEEIRQAVEAVTLEFLGGVR